MENKPEPFSPVAIIGVICIIISLILVLMTGSIVWLIIGIIFSAVGTYFLKSKNT